MPTARAVRGLTFALHDEIIAARAMPHGPEKIEIMDLLTQIANRIRDWQMPRMKTLEEFDFAQAPQIPAAKIRELA